MYIIEKRINNQFLFLKNAMFYGVNIGEVELTH